MATATTSSSTTTSCLLHPRDQTAPEPANPGPGIIECLRAVEKPVEPRSVRRGQRADGTLPSGTPHRVRTDDRETLASLVGANL